MVYLLIQYVTIRTVANAAPTKRHAQSAMTDSVLINYLLPTIYFNVVILLVHGLGADDTTCAGKFIMLRYGLFPTIVVHGFGADGTSYASTFIVEQKFNLFSIIYCTVVRVLVVVVVVVFAVVVGVIVAVGIVPNEYLNKWCIC